MKWKITKIETHNDMGKILAKTRLKLGLSINKVASDYFLPKYFLEAIENNRYERLPDKVYALAMLKKYFNVLNLPAGKHLALWEEGYIHWHKLNKQAKISDKVLLRDKMKWQITPSFWQKSILVFLGLIFLIYIGLQVEAAIAPAELKIISPVNELITSERSIEVVGKTEAETIVTINSHVVSVDGEGIFRERINLQKGLNILSIEATKKYRPSHVAVRHILVTEGE